MMRPRHIWLLLVAPVLLSCAGLQPKPIFTTSSENSSSKSQPETAVPEEKAAEKNPDAVLEHPRAPEPEDNVLRERMMREIENLLGTPYRYGGNSPREGLDCSGFVGYVFRRSLNLDLPRNVEALWRYGTPISQSELSFGDLVFFRFNRTGKLDHVGIYLGDGVFAHASKSNGVEFSSLRSSYYRDRFAGARRVLR